jgi:hypothetical protein
MLLRDDCTLAPSSEVRSRAAFKSAVGVELELGEDPVLEGV